tara:strand:+ start:572 stop:769 length:198 start_codon:yes stop_codon:yes gene_type:complete
MKDLFEKQICVDCNKSCAFGSGRFVNRYSVYNDDVKGWRCGLCVEKLDSELERSLATHWALQNCS